MENSIRDDNDDISNLSWKSQHRENISKGELVYTVFDETFKHSELTYFVFMICKGIILLN